MLFLGGGGVPCLLSFWPFGTHSIYLLPPSYLITRPCRWPINFSTKGCNHTQTTQPRMVEMPDRKHLNFGGNRHPAPQRFNICLFQTNLSWVLRSEELRQKKPPRNHGWRQTPKGTPISKANSVPVRNHSYNPTLLSLAQPSVFWERCFISYHASWNPLSANPSKAPGNKLCARDGWKLNDRA